MQSERYRVKARKNNRLYGLESSRGGVVITNTQINWKKASGFAVFKLEPGCTLNLDNNLKYKESIS